MSWINTFTGKQFCYAKPAVENICIEDIAQALSHECRFAGHLPEFYSVAQHSVLVSKIVRPELALEALLHDAHEAYCKDIPSPLKHMLPDYQYIESSIDSIIRYRFNLPASCSPAIKYADLVILATERRDLGIDDGTPWPILEDISPSEEEIVIPLNPAQARGLFAQRYFEITGERIG
ncbi:HD family hydrolase [Serratia microhaemolytica]|uniref:HD family hydrolase n=1 Tax=Serratia microhaemolytica TaxID=2675110 RepID=UPI000FDD8420|nr:HD family hydrolase [Serratia microhaemolytica]